LVEIFIFKIVQTETYQPTGYQFDCGGFDRILKFDEPKPGSLPVWPVFWSILAGAEER
jgi:hypothetical protein